MPVSLALLIQRTEAALAAPDLSPKKKARLERDLAAYRYSQVAAESDGDGDGDDDPDDDENDKAAKHAKRAEMNRKKSEALKHKAKADDHRRQAEEEEEEARKCMGDEDDEEDEEAKALRASLAVSATGMPEGARAALASQAGQDAALRAQLETIQKERAAEKMQASIDAALTARRITPGEAKTLAKKPPEFVSDFLAMRPKAIVNTDETHLSQPDPRENADLDPKALAEITARVAALPNLTDAQREDVKKKMIEGRRAVMNGATVGRY